LAASVNRFKIIYSAVLPDQLSNGLAGSQKRFADGVAPLSEGRME
jgi:hypothetical protein